MKKVNSKRTHEVNLKIGETIKNRRKELGITQEELSKRLGFAHKTSIAKIENATRELQMEDAIKLAPILNLQLDDLIGFSEYMGDDTNIKNAAQASNKLIDDPELANIILRITELEPEKREKVIQAINLMLD